MNPNDVIRAIDNDSDVAKELKARIAELEAKLGLVEEWKADPYMHDEDDPLSNVVWWPGLNAILATEKGEK